MRVLHLFTDWWLCDMAADVFKHSPGCHEFVILRYENDFNKPIEFIKDKGLVKNVCIGSSYYKYLLKGSEWDVVWVHGLYQSKATAVDDLDSRVKLVWTTWGFDYLFFGPMWLFGFRTTLKWLRCFFTNRHVFKQKILYWLICQMRLNWTMRFNPFVKSHHRSFARFLQRVDYFSTTVPEEAPLVRMSLGGRAKWFPFHCINYKRIINPSTCADLDSKRVLLGNSATITNNHYDVIPMLALSKDYEVYAPLSYTLEGIKIDDYTRDVIEYGKKWLGERFHPMTGFLPYDEYIKSVMPSSVYVFGHRRSQALGNISIALTRGGCVFLDPINPIYKFYIKSGIIIYPLSKLKEGISNVVKEFRPYQSQNIERMRTLRAHRKLLAENLDSVGMIWRDVLNRRKASYSGGREKLFFTYRVIFDINGGNDGVMNRCTMTYGIVGRLPDNRYKKVGKEFAGWSDSPNGRIMWRDGGYIITPPIKDGKCRLYAIWREPTYVNMFDANGGSGYMASIRRIVMKVEKLPKNRFTRVGYTFIGWSYKPDGDLIWKDEGVIENPPIKDGVAVLYALWVPVKYELLFNPNGGKGVMDSVVATYGEQSRLPKNVFVKKNCIFAGWSYLPNKNVVWPDGGSVVAPPLKDEKCQLYAIWSKMTYEIEFDANGGIGCMPRVRRRRMEKSRLPKNRFLRSEYKFCGWSYKPDGDLIWKDEGVIENPPIKDGVAVLYALWVPVKYELLFNPNGGKGD